MGLFFAIFKKGKCYLWISYTFRINIKKLKDILYNVNVTEILEVQIEMFLIFHLIQENY